MCLHLYIYRFKLTCASLCQSTNIYYVPIENTFRLDWILNSPASLYIIYSMDVLNQSIGTSPSSLNPNPHSPSL